MGIDTATGLETVNNGPLNIKGFIVGCLQIPLALNIIGAGIACLIFFFGNNERHWMQIDKLNSLTDGQSGWIYLTAYLYAKVVWWLNQFPTLYKGRVGFFGNHRANPFIFKALGDDAPKCAIVY